MSAYPAWRDESVFAALLDAIAGEPDDVALLIQSYFDESFDDETHGMLCVAGYVFNSLRAKWLDGDWRRMLLGAKQLPYFRMSACNKGAEPFDRLTKDECIAVEKRAIKLIERHASFGVAVTIDQDAFYKIITKDGFVRSPYELCTWMVLTGVLTWMDKQPNVGGAAFFFEAGHKHQGQSNDLMNGLFNSPTLRERYKYRGHAFVDKVASRPSQAADILAWQWYKDSKRRANGATKPRADLAALIKGTRHIAVHLDAEMMLKVIAWMDEQAGGSDGNRWGAYAIRGPWPPPGFPERDS